MIDDFKIAADDITLASDDGLVSVHEKRWCDFGNFTSTVIRVSTRFEIRKCRQRHHKKKMNNDRPNCPTCNKHRHQSHLITASPSKMS